MSKSYFPADRAGRIDWYNNFAKEFPQAGKDLGFSETEITNAVNDSNYAVHILTTLGPDIDADPGQAANYKAELGRARQTGNFVTIPFRKAGGGVSGINLYRQGKGDKSPQKVGFFFRTPAIDTAHGKGELKYTARAVTNGNEIGQASDAVSVTAS